MRRLVRSGAASVSLSWGVLALGLVATVWSVTQGAVGWSLFGLGLACAILVTPVSYGSTEVMPSWPVVVLATVPLVVGVVAPEGTLQRIAAYAGVAALALLVAIQVDTFTPVRMNRGFAVAFVVMVTVTAAGLWELGKWALDLVVGTSLVESNKALMWRLVASAVAGVVAGVVFDRYLSRLPGTTVVPDGVDSDDVDDQADVTDEHVTNVLEDAGLSRGGQRILFRGVQVVLATILVVGIVTLELDVVVSGGVGVGATFLPAVLQRDRGAHTDAGLALWVGVAVFLHALGSLGFYESVWGWDDLAHATSGSLVAAVGYTTVRALEQHTRSIAFPPQFTFGVVVLFVFSVGVSWEMLEFTLDGIAENVGRDSIALAQHGLTDTLADLVANAVGAAVVAGAATVYRLRRRG